MADEADDNEIRRKLKNFIFPTDAGAQNSSNVGQIEEARGSSLPGAAPAAPRAPPSLTPPPHPFPLRARSAQM